MKKNVGLYYCNRCKYVGLIAIIGQSAKTECKQCKNAVNVYEAVHFTRSLINRLATVTRELKVLKNQEINKPEVDEDESEKISTSILAEVKLEQTDMFANHEQHQPLEKWFASKHIKTEFDFQAVDMTGYYDEAAVKIANAYDIFESIIGKIAWAYQKKHTGFNLDISKYSQQQVQFITNTLREFYSHTLFSRYSYQKKEKVIHLKLQKAQPIQQFLTGGWLEWFALITLLQNIKERGGVEILSCARGAKVYFANQDMFELDVLFLVNNKPPLVIECKTGEFRQDINKFLDLQKRLQIPAKNFVILSSNITNEQAKSLSAMYGLSFVNISMFAQLLDSL